MLGLSNGLSAVGFKTSLPGKTRPKQAINLTGGLAPSIVFYPKFPKLAERGNQTHMISVVMIYAARQDG